MKRLEIVKQVAKCGLVAVIRAESKEQGVKAGAVSTGGEITKGAKTNDYELVKEVADRFVDELKRARGL